MTTVSKVHAYEDCKPVALSTLTFPDCHSECTLHDCRAAPDAGSATFAITASKPSPSAAKRGLKCAVSNHPSCELPAGSPPLCDSPNMISRCLTTQEAFSEVVPHARLTVALTQPGSTRFFPQSAKAGVQMQGPQIPLPCPHASTYDRKNSMKLPMLLVHLVLLACLTSGCTVFTEPVRFDSVADQDRRRENWAWRTFINDRPGWTENFHSDRINCRSHAEEIALQAERKGFQRVFATGILADGTHHVVAVVEGKNGTQYAFDNGRIAAYPFPPRELSHWMSNIGWHTTLPIEKQTLITQN